MSIPPTSERGAAARYAALVAALLGWLFDGFEMGLFPVISRTALASLLGFDGSAITQAQEGTIGSFNGLIIAAFLVGAATGGVLFGWLGDKLGRVNAMALSILTYAGVSGLGAFVGLTGLEHIVPGAWQMVAVRFIAALGMGGEWALGVALVMEVWGDRSRALLAGLIGAAANVGYVLVALLSLGIGQLKATLGEWNLPPDWIEWRLLMLMGVLPAVTGRGAIPRMVLGACLSGVPLLGTWASVQWAPTWGAELSQKAIKAVERGEKEPDLPQVVVREAKAYTQMASALGASVGAFAGALLGMASGRRWAYALLCLGSLAAVQLFFRSNDELSLWFFFTMFLAGALSASFYGWLPLYLPELFPTRQRATGQGFSFNFGRVVAAVGALQTGALMKGYFQGDYARACSIMALVYLVGLLVILFAPETHGEALPD